MNSLAQHPPLLRVFTYPVRSGRGLVPPLVWVLALLPGCDGEVPEAGVTTRDSAGVTIVTSGSPTGLDDLPTPWRQGIPAEVEIGVFEGGPAYEFDFAASSVRTGDGRYAIVNAGTSELRFFDRAGVHERTVGRDGEGPGEFRRLTVVYRFPGDSLVTYDRSLQRATIFDSFGNVGRIVEILTPDGGAQPTLAGVFDDGSFLVFAITPADLDEDVGIQREEGQVLHYDTRGDSFQLITPLATQEWAFVNTTQGRMPQRRAFTPDGWPATDGKVAYIGDSVRDEIRVFEPDGTLVKIIRRSAPLRAVTPEIIADYASARLPDPSADVPDEYRAYMQSILRNMPYPETLPAFRGIRPAPDGRLWVRVVALPGDSNAAYSVFDPRGAWVGDVALPGDFWLQDVGTDYLLGRTVDNLGVERISMYGIPGP